MEPNALTARLVAKLPGGPDWLYELKFDGYRALVLEDRRYGLDHLEEPSGSDAHVPERGC